MRRYQLAILSDSRLLVLLRERDDIGAFEEIYDRYWRILLDIAYQRLKSKEAAEEIVQEVMISLFVKRRDIIITSSLAGWLKTALKYKVYNIYRSQQVHLAHLSDIISQNQISPLLPDEALMLKEIREKVIAVASKLPGKCREVFMLSRTKYLTHQEIADQLNISVSTVKKHLTKALATLRAELREDHINLLAIAMIIIMIPLK